MRDITRRLKEIKETFSGRPENSKAYFGWLKARDLIAGGAS